MLDEVSSIEIVMQKLYFRFITCISQLFISMFGSSTVIGVHASCQTYTLLSITQKYGQ